MNIDPHGYYAILGVEPTATFGEIKAAYRRRAKEAHPDVGGASKSFVFRSVQNAYDVLRVPASRAAYDSVGKNVRSSADPSRSDPLKPPRPHVREGRPIAFAVAGILFVCVVLWLSRFSAPGQQANTTSTQSSQRGQDSYQLTNSGSKPGAPAAETSSNRSGNSLPRTLGRDGSVELPTVSAFSALPGEPTHYMLPLDGPTIIWRKDPNKGYVSDGFLAPFTNVELIASLSVDRIAEVRVASGQLVYLDPRGDA